MHASPIVRLAVHGTLAAALTITLGACGSNKPDPAPKPLTAAKPQEPKPESRFVTAVRNIGDYVQLRATAGAGFSGIRVAEVVESPAYSLDKRCPTCTDSVLVLRADSVDLIPNNRYMWKPALSTGLSANVYSNRASKAGIGIGGQIVFVPDAEGHTSAFPAVTLHVGSPDKEVFFGMIFSPTDRVVLPNGQSSVRTARVGTRPDFVRKGTGNSRALYMGIQIGGVRVTGAETPAGADQSNSPAVARVKLEPQTLELKVGEEGTVTAVFYDAEDNVLGGRTASFLSLDRTKATVPSGPAAKVKVKGVAAGTTKIRIQKNDLYDEATVKVSAP